MGINPSKKNWAVKTRPGVNLFEHAENATSRRMYYNRGRASLSTFGLVRYANGNLLEQQMRKLTKVASRLPAGNAWACDAMFAGPRVKGGHMQITPR